MISLVRTQGSFSVAHETHRQSRLLSVGGDDSASPQDSEHARVSQNPPGTQPVILNPHKPPSLVPSDAPRSHSLHRRHYVSMTVSMAPADIAKGHRPPATIAQDDIPWPHYKAARGKHPVGSLTRFGEAGIEHVTPSRKREPWGN